MYKKGTIILVPFPFTDLSGTKVRPAIIISNYKKASRDITVLFITSQKKAGYTNLVPIAPTPENGIKAKSHIICSKIATLEKTIVLGEIGHVSDQTQKQIDGELKKIFGL